MKGIAGFLTNVAIAVVATLIVLGPTGVMVWYSWRNLLAAAMIYTAFGLVMFSLMAAGQSAWTPGPSPLPLIGIAVIIGAGLGYGAWRLSEGTLAARIVTVPLSLVALGWVIAFWAPLRDSWRHVGANSTVSFARAVGHREGPGSDRQRLEARKTRAAPRADSTGGTSDSAASVPHPPPDAFVLLKFRSDRTEKVRYHDRRDVMYVGRTDLESSRAFLELIADERVRRYRQGRNFILVTEGAWDQEIEDALGVSVAALSPDAHVDSGIAPGFFDFSAGTFSRDPYEWMTDVLRIPQAERDAIYSTHFGKVPE